MSLSTGGNCTRISGYSAPYGAGSYACLSTPSTSRSFNSSFAVSSGSKGMSPNLSKRGSLDAKFSTVMPKNHASILNSPIQFVAAKGAFENDSNELKRKYLCISRENSGQLPRNGDEANGSCTSPKPFDSNGLSENGDSNGIHNVEATSSGAATSVDIPAPQFDIFPGKGVRLQWDPALRCSTGVGLNNLGNTCFLNSVLQVLTNTAPLVNYLFSDDHQERPCPSSTGFCALCIMRAHVQRAFSCARSGQDTFSPNAIVSRLRCFMKSHSTGRQEDAHEFLRYFTDAMQTAALFQYKDQKLDLFTKETSLISRIFGGYHKNEIVCNSCHSSSVTYDPFLDLSVEIKQSNTLEAALAHFTCAETLASDNAYLCPKCKRRVSARKMFTIIQPPNILTIQLKRFDHFGKIDRFITYPERLNLRPYMSEKQGPPINYKLYGVVVHVGRTTHSGHYFAFVRNPCDQWHLMDDSRVSVVPAMNALRHASAYLLFYIRQPTPVASVRPQAKAHLGFIGPQRQASAPIAVSESPTGPAQNDNPGFKPAFSNPALSTAASATAGIASRTQRVVGQSLKRPLPVISDEKRLAQLPGIRVQPVKFRLNPIKKLDDAKRSGSPASGGHKEASSVSTGKEPSMKSVIKPGKPIQDSSVSSSTKLVPYDIDDEDEEADENGATK